MTDILALDTMVAVACRRCGAVLSEPATFEQIPEFIERALQGWSIDNGFWICAKCREAAK